MGSGPPMYASAASTEVLIGVGGAALPPGAPDDFTAVVSGSTVTISWNPPGSGGAAWVYVASNRPRIDDPPDPAPGGVYRYSTADWPTAEASRSAPCCCGTSSRA